MKCMNFILVTTKREPLGYRVLLFVVMSDLSQYLCSRVPPLHSALALYNDGVSWYQLWVPPCTLLRVLFE